MSILPQKPLFMEASFLCYLIFLPDCPYLLKWEISQTAEIFSVHIRTHRKLFSIGWEKKTLLLSHNYRNCTIKTFLWFLYKNFCKFLYSLTTAIGLCLCEAQTVVRKHSHLLVIFLSNSKVIFFPTQAKVSHFFPCQI